MDSYQLISRFRKVRDGICLTTTAQALCCELVSVCSKMKQREVLKKKDSELCPFFNISEETLIKSRIDLSDVGLPYFQSTRDKRIGCYYPFTTVISSVYLPDESTDDSTDETRISPIIDIKTINKEESLAYTYKSSPPDKRKSRKEKGDKASPVYPFTSMAFMSTWEILRKTPK